MRAVLALDELRLAPLELKLGLGVLVPGDAPALHFLHPKDGGGDLLLHEGEAFCDWCLLSCEPPPPSPWHLCSLFS